MGDLPGVCVVVSAYDRAQLLPALVRALRAQTYPDVEFVLVDNGSSDDTRQTLVELTGDDDRFRVLHVDDNRGPARARNLAWRTTRRTWIAFTDDDCEPEPTWVERLVDAAETAEIVQGRTVPVPADVDGMGWFDRSQRITSWSGRFETCNLLVRRDVLEEADGFNERFPIAMGEDTDMGLRAVARGARTGFADDAVVHHHVWRSGFREYLAHRRRYSHCVELFRVNPAARSLLRLGITVRTVHLLVWGLVPLTVVGTLVGAPWVAIPVAGGWCLLNAHRTRRRNFSWPRRVGYSAAQFVSYVYETGCFAWASVRHRTLVL